MPRRRHRRRRTAPGFLLGLAAVLLLAVAAFVWQSRHADEKSPPTGSPAPVGAEGPPAAPAAPRTSPPAEEVEAPAPTVVGRIALVIDDLGRSIDTVDRLSSLGVPVAGAVLPFEPRSEAVARTLAARGIEVLCHLPMEPAAEGADPGPGALRRSMDAETLRRTTRRALEAVPGAVGANNHMGSAFSADAESMRPVLEELAAHGLFFLDSRTGPESIGYRLARALALPAAERDVFLDSVDDGSGIEERWRELLDLARRDGAAIAIGHPHDTTLTFLVGAVPEAAAAGIEFVPVSYLVDRAGSLPL